MTRYKLLYKMTQKFQMCSSFFFKKLSHIKCLIYFYQMYKCQVTKWIWQHYDGISINSNVCNELSCPIESNNVQNLLHLINVIISSFSISLNKVANSLNWNKCEDIVFLVPLSVPLSLANPQDPTRIQQ
jgi:hypothetical protein